MVRDVKRARLFSLRERGRIVSQSRFRSLVQLFAEFFVDFKGDDAGFGKVIEKVMKNLLLLLERKAADFQNGKGEGWFRSSYELP